VTAYQRIADSLRQRLLAGDWASEEQLPTERELCRQFGASQITVRRAMQIIEDEHLVERRQGRGTFATSAAQRKIPILNTDFFGSIRRHAPRLERSMHSCQRAEIDAELAGVLRASIGDPVLLAVRIDRMQGKPATMDEVAILGRYADRLQEDDLARLDFVERWQRVQKLRLKHCEQTIEAIKAKLPISRLLEVRAGEPLLKETSLIFAAAGQPAGLFISYYRHDCFRFNVTFDFGGRPKRGAGHE
jgi:GntR family transcriptional regulator